MMWTELIQSTLSEELIVLILAALPVAELRGSLPVAIDILHIPWPQALLISIVGNLFPVPFLLKFYDIFARLISRNRRGKNFVEWIYNRTRKHTGIIEKYKHLGLIIFVAIPLPGTGACTASIAAHFLGIKFGYAFLDIALGVIGAGIIVTALTLLGWFGLAIAVIGILGLTVFSIWRQKALIGR
jgi:uncharacterized membrane protein